MLTSLVVSFVTTLFYGMSNTYQGNLSMVSISSQVCLGVAWCQEINEMWDGLVETFAFNLMTSILSNLHFTFYC